jgi:hypothetical protein
MDSMALSYCTINKYSPVEVDRLSECEFLPKGNCDVLGWLLPLEVCQYSGTRQQLASLPPKPQYHLEGISLPRPGLHLRLLLEPSAGGREINSCRKLATLPPPPQPAQLEKHLNTSISGLFPSGLISLTPFMNAAAFDPLNRLNAGILTTFAQLPTQSH